MKYFFLFFLCPMLCFCQKNKNWENRSAINTEISMLKRQFFIPAINYENTFFYKKKLQLGISTGIGIFTKFNEKLNFEPIFFPLKIYAAIGKKKHFFRVGAGCELSIFQAIFPKFLLGYQFQSNKKGLYFLMSAIGTVLTDQSLPPSWTERKPSVISWGGGITIGKYFGQY